MAESTTPAAAVADLIERERSLRAIERVLCVNLAWPLATPPAQLTETATDACGALTVDRALRVDLALIRLDAAHACGANIDATLAQLRDLHATRILALVPIDAATALEHHLRSLGLDTHARVTMDGRTMQTFRFDATCTKPTPTWLNADHWANPERWNRHRW